MRRVEVVCKLEAKVEAMAAEIGDLKANIDRKGPEPYSELLKRA